MLCERHKTGLNHIEQTEVIQFKLLNKPENAIDGGEFLELENELFVCIELTVFSDWLAVCVM